MCFPGRNENAQTRRERGNGGGVESGREGKGRRGGGWKVEGKGRGGGEVEVTVRGLGEGEGAGSWLGNESCWGRGSDRKRAERKEKIKQDQY
jgi:hypothetical protein